MSDFSSLPSLPYKKFYSPPKMKGGADSSDAAIIAIVVVIIVILLVAIIMAACWGCGSQTETVYVTTPDGKTMRMQMPKKKARAYKQAGKALKDLPPLNPHRRGGKTYDLAGGAKVAHLSSEGEARQLLQGNQPAMLFVYMTGCGFCEKAKAYFNDHYAAEHPGVKLAMMDHKNCQGLCQQHGVTGFPTFLSNFGGQGVQKHVGYKPKDVMSSILQAAHGGKMRMSTQGRVQELSDADEARHLMQTPGTKVLLFLYAPWCGYCKKQKPELDALAADPSLSDIQFVAMNAEGAGKKIADAMKVSGYPTFLTNFGHGPGENPAGPKVHVGYKDAAALKQQVLQR